MNQGAKAFHQDIEILTTTAPTIRELIFLFGATYSSVYGMRKSVYIISLPDLIRHLQDAGYHARYCVPRTCGMKRIRNQLDGIYRMGRYGK